MTEFGTIVTPDDVSRGLEQHIRTWQRTALDAAAEGRDFSRRLPAFRSYRHSNGRPEKWDEDALPCCVIVVDDADANSRGTAYDLFFSAAIVVIAGARDQDTANRLAKTMAGALASLVVNKPGFPVGELDGFGGFRSSELPQENERMLAMGVFGIGVFVPDALTVGDWPTTPLPDPNPDTPPTYPDSPTAETVGITVNTMEG